MSINGFYAGYMTGVGGSGVAIFAFQNGVIVGADMGGVLFDGSYAPDDEGSLVGRVVVNVPEGVTVIQGVTAPAGGLRYEVDLALSPDFLTEPYIKIKTPIGSINARLQKLRDL